MCQRVQRSDPWALDPWVQVFVDPNVPEGPGMGPRGPTVPNSSGVQVFQVAQGSKCARCPAVPGV